MTENKFLKFLDYIGKISGCHRLPDRSFHYKSYQFPVCARCTGVFVGNVISVLLVFFYIPDLWFLITGCCIMFLDWFVQYIDIAPSNNIRRLITGILGGYCFTTLHFWVIVMLVKTFLV